MHRTSALYPNLFAEKQERVRERCGDGGKRQAIGHCKGRSGSWRTFGTGKQKRLEITHERNKGLYSWYAVKLKEASELMMRVMLYALPVLSNDVLDEILVVGDLVIRMRRAYSKIAHTAYTCYPRCLCSTRQGQQALHTFSK